MKPMKKSDGILTSIGTYILGILAVCQVTFLSAIAYAQEKKTDINVDIGGDGGAAWYANWWIIAIGLAIFVIVIIAIVSAGRNR